MRNSCDLSLRLVILQVIISIICLKDSYQVDLTCVSLEKCPAALNMVEKHAYSPEIMSFIRTFKCMYSPKAGFRIWCPQPDADIHKTTDDRIYYEEKGEYFLPEGMMSKGRKPSEEVKREQPNTEGFIWGASNTANHIHLTTKESVLKEHHVVTTQPVEETEKVVSHGGGMAPFLARDSKMIQRNTPKPPDLEDRIYFPDDFESFSNARQPKSNPLDGISSSCGRPFYQSENFVSDNSTAGLGEFPWMVLLEYDNSGRKVPGCSGVLISSRHVLTTASCVHSNNLSRRNLGKLFQVVLGDLDTGKETDCVQMRYGQVCGDFPVKVGVQSSLIHEGFNGIISVNDIAILKLENNVEFTDFIKPICLPEQGSVVTGDSKLLTATWQRYGKNGKLILTKSKITMEKFKSKSLQEPGLCTGFPGNSLIEQDFSKFGSPFYLKGLDAGGLKSRSCSNTTRTRTIYVTNFRGWIDDNIV